MVGSHVASHRATAPAGADAMLNVMEPVYEVMVVPLLLTAATLTNGVIVESRGHETRDG